MVQLTMPNVRIVGGLDNFLKALTELWECYRQSSQSVFDEIFSMQHRIENEKVRLCVKLFNLFRKSVSIKTKVLI